jgi:hypothetical protein
MTALLQMTSNAAPRVLGAAVIVALVITFLDLLRRLFSDASLPSNLPWAGVGEHSGRLGKARANLSSFFHLKELLNEGYTKVRQVLSLLDDRLAYHPT